MGRYLARLALHRDKKLEQIGRVWNLKKKRISLTWARQFKDICFISLTSKHVRKKPNLQKKFAVQDCGYFRLGLSVLFIMKVSQDVWKEKDSKEIFLPD